MSEGGTFGLLFDIFANLFWFSFLQFIYLGLVFLVVYSGIRNLRDALKRRDMLGRPQNKISENDLNRPVALVGKLRAQGLCPRFEDGKPSAASTVCLLTDPMEACTIRADSLNVEVGGDFVALDGPIDVVVGSFEKYSSKQTQNLREDIRDRIEQAGGLPSQHYLHMKSLCDGDWVIVSGILSIESDEKKATYREKALRWKLLPLPLESDAIQGIPWIAVAAENPQTGRGMLSYLRKVRR